MLATPRTAQPAVAADSAVGRASRSLWTLQLNGNALGNQIRTRASDKHGCYMHLRTGTDSFNCPYQGSPPLIPLPRSHYPPLPKQEAPKRSPSANAIAKKLGKGVRKAKVSDDATGGPCVDRGGFHTNVLREGSSAASIVGCNCCDDSSGKAIRKQRADIVYK